MKNVPKHVPKPVLPLRPAPAEKAVSRAELSILLQKVSELAEQKPEKAAIILADWLQRSASRASSRKKAG